MSAIKQAAVLQYLEETPGEMSSIRSVILFGKNTATYKFALCEAITKQKVESRIGYDDLVEDFAKALLRHTLTHPFQEQGSKQGELIRTCIEVSQGKKDLNLLLNVARKIMPRYVFDAFQNIGSGTLGTTSRLFENNRIKKEIILSDIFLRTLSDQRFKKILEEENEARWRVVEEAWRIGLSPSIISYDETTGLLIEHTNKNARINLRSAVDSLLPYQKGLCFYCNRTLRTKTENSDDDFADVDHLLPLSQLARASIDRKLTGININGIWNLVISCKACNRGAGGKFDRPPNVAFIQKLLTRNELFTLEHKHSFRFAILSSLGVSEPDQIKPVMAEIWNLFSNQEQWMPNYYFDTKITD
ncbi:MAG: hypothetical protein RIR26_82 [Pseudomonadota bacterium]